MPLRLVDSVCMPDSVHEILVNKEEFVIGRFHGKSFQQSIGELAGGTWRGILILSVLLCIMLVPFFGFTELRPEQIVQVRWGMGSKGCMAAELRPDGVPPGLPPKH